MLLFRLVRTFDSVRCLLGPIRSDSRGVSDISGLVRTPVISMLVRIRGRLLGRHSGNSLLVTRPCLVPLCEVLSVRMLTLALIVRPVFSNRVVTVRTFEL